MWKIFKRKTEPAKPAAKVKRKGVDVGLKRDYAAGIMDRLTSSWTTVSASSDQIVYSTLSTLRARSREQSRNGDHGKKFISMVRNNVVGPNGFSIQSRVMNRDGTADEFARQAIEKHLKIWSKPKNCSITNRLSLTRICSIALTTIARDGEVLVKLHTAGEYGLKLELLDPDRLDIQYNDTLPSSGNYIRFGIEFNPQGQAVAYHLNMPNNADGPNVYVSSLNRKKYQRIPAEQMMHLFLDEEVEQKRGIPWMSTALLRMKMLQGFEDASLTNARAGASKMGFYKQNDLGAFEGQEGDDGEIIEDFEAGTISIIPTDMEWQSHDPQYPDGEFAIFVKWCLRSIASGIGAGVSYNSLANDLENVSFSSIRQAAVEEREIWKELQQWFIEQFMQPIYEEWLTRAHAFGMITVTSKNGNETPLRRDIEEYLPADFQGKRWSWVDPLKDVQAKREEILLGITSPSAVIRESGKDPEQVWKELESDISRLKSLGITLQEKPNGEQNQDNDDT